MDSEGRILSVGRGKATDRVPGPRECLARSTLQVPDAGTVEEAGDDSVFADLEDGSEPAGDEGCRGAGPFGGDRPGEGGGIVAEDGAEGEQPPGAVGRQRAVEPGQGLEDGRVEV